MSGLESSTAQSSFSFLNEDAKASFPNVFLPFSFSTSIVFLVFILTFWCQIIFNKTCFLGNLCCCSLKANWGDSKQEVKLQAFTFPSSFLFHLICFFCPTVSKHQTICAIKHTPPHFASGSKQFLSIKWRIIVFEHGRLTTTSRD